MLKNNSCSQTSPRANINTNDCHEIDATDTAGVTADLVRPDHIRQRIRSYLRGFGATCKLKNVLCDNNRRITQLFKSNLYAIKNLVVASCCQLSKGRVEIVKEIQVSWSQWFLCAYHKRIHITVRVPNHRPPPPPPRPRAHFRENYFTFCNTFLSANIWTRSICGINLIT